jgi:hypothetical protein
LEDNDGEHYATRSNIIRSRIISSFNQVVKSRKNNVTIVSYYDRIINSIFNPEIKTVSWTMPFDWNLSRTSHQNILVHEEVKVPKSLFDASPFDFAAFLDGMPLTGRSITIDPYSSVNTTTVHLLLNKHNIVDLLNERTSDLDNDTMSFSLVQVESGKQLSSTDIVTDNGQVGISLTLNPKELTAHSKSIISLSFKDPSSDDAIAADVTYGVEILDNKGKPIFNENSQTVLHDAEGKIEVEFPEKGIYQIRILVESLAPLDSDLVDTTSPRLAWGYLLVE